MQLIGPLAAQPNFDMLRHVLEKWMKEHHGHISIFTVPSQLGEASFKGLLIQKVLMMNQVVMGGHQFSRSPVRIVFTLGHGPTFWNRLPCAFGSFVGDSSDKA
tara:strand:+ start:408 stop:716 length:309 start_codon:yes stop_codon:yes gene_type:complete